jgi:hypothetical protein
MNAVLVVVNKKNKIEKHLETFEYVLCELHCYNIFYKIVNRLFIKNLTKLVKFQMNKKTLN